MPRLLGGDIPNDRPTVISLTYLYGVGPQIARELCHKAGVDPQAKARDLHEDEHRSRIACERLLLESHALVRSPERVVQRPRMPPDQQASAPPSQAPEPR